MPKIPLYLKRVIVAVVVFALAVLGVASVAAYRAHRFAEEHHAWFAEQHPHPTGWQREFAEGQILFDDGQESALVGWWAALPFGFKCFFGSFHAQYVRPQGLFF